MLVHVLIVMSSVLNFEIAKDFEPFMLHHVSHEVIFTEFSILIA